MLRGEGGYWLSLWCNELSLLEPDDGRPVVLVSNTLLRECLNPEHAYRVSKELHGD